MMGIPYRNAHRVSKKMKTVFGPIPSRRLGQSLGIDPIPLKTCNWNCVYCQLGRSRPMTNERKEYVDPDIIMAQLDAVLAAHAPGEIDWLTFVGSGEPILHAGLGHMIRQVKQITDIPVAVITNGALLFLPEVQQDLLAADAVLPSLDAGNKVIYKKINRPHPGVPFDQVIAGLIEFRQVYQGKYWIEIMMVRGVNETEPALKELAAVLDQIDPDEVHINQPIRPPAETWVQPADDEGLIRARAILGDRVRIFTFPEGHFEFDQFENAVEAVLTIITRHPMRQSELEQTLQAWGREEISEALEKLRTSGRVQIVERYGIQFWSAATSYYP
jgi:wyosine [tRNA(Phe)-imidazoG37] synthetase (radical SAM superfamily)